MKVKLSFDARSNPEAVLITIDCLDPALVGHDAKLTITAEATVHDSRPVHGARKLVVESFRLREKGPVRIFVSRYQGT